MRDLRKHLHVTFLSVHKGVLSEGVSFLTVKQHPCM